MLSSVQSLRMTTTGARYVFVKTFFDLLEAFLV